MKAPSPWIAGPLFLSSILPILVGLAVMIPKYHVAGVVFTSAAAALAVFWATMLILDLKQSAPRNPPDAHQP